MIKVQAFQATDGQLFTDAEECQLHENTIRLSALRDFIDSRIDETYDDSVGYNIITLENVVDFILKYGQTVDLQMLIAQAKGK